MTITHRDDPDGPKAIGRIVANPVDAMAGAMDSGTTTRELDGIGRALLRAAVAQPAPEVTRAITGGRVLATGDLVDTRAVCPPHPDPLPPGGEGATWAGAVLIQPRGA